MRPGRSSAGSSASGRLVAPSTNTPPPPVDRPSISASSWLSTRAAAESPDAQPAPAAPLRRGAIASCSHASHQPRDMNTVRLLQPPLTLSDPIYDPT